MNHRPWALTLLLATSGCLWIQSTATEVSPADVDRPAPEPGKTGDGPGRASDRTAGAGRAPQTDVEMPTLPPITERAWQPVDPQIALVPGGMRVAAGQWTTAPVAVLELTIVHRQLPSMARNGIARLTAELLIDAPLDDGARPSLRRMVENGGGTLAIDVDAVTTRFTLTLPPYLWRRALTDLAAAVGTIPTSRDRVEATRKALVEEYGERWFRDPLSAGIDRVTAFEFAGLPEWLTRLEDARIDDVVAHQVENYRAPSAMLTLAVPDANPTAAIDDVQTAFATWLSASTSRLPEANPTQGSAGGTFWSADGARPEVAAVFDLDPPTAQNAAAQRVVVECLLASAVDGRLPDELARLPQPPTLALRTRASGARQRLELYGVVTAGQVDGVRRAVAKALASLQERPPGDEEIRQAAARARFRLAETVGDSIGWTHEVSRLMLGGALADELIERDGKRTPITGADPLTTLATALQKPDALDVGAAIAAAIKGRGLVVAIGADLSSIPQLAQMPGAVIPIERRQVAVADFAAQEARANEVLDLACRSVGGTAAVLGFEGFRAVALQRSGRGPEVVDQEWYRTDGRYRRVRHVLASTIETVVEGRTGGETCDSETIALDEAAARLELDAAERHPLALLAGWARKTARYRLVSEREFVGRPIAVLERADGDAGRIRMFVDTESGLVRAVLAREDRPNGVVWVREEWRDYRDAGKGLRAPFHRTRWIDDGLNGVVATFTVVDAETPGPTSLEPGGPLR